jgi:glycine betaine/proline transport system substrate-binding protein
MDDQNASSPSLTNVLAAVVLATGLLAGCSGGDDPFSMVTVNWIEGMAMTYVQEQLLEDSLGVDVEVNEVQGGGIAFSSVASGNADVFNEAWLPTTHEEPWEKNKNELQKLGYTYKGTSVGWAVPTYMEVDTIPDLMDYTEELNGTINGIEAGSAINEQTRRTLQRYDMADAFSVSSASGPATWQALESAIQDKKPIVVVGWYPHWKWTEFDLKYVDGAKTNHNVDIWGRPEDIFTVVGNDFVNSAPKEASCFLKEFEINDDQVVSLMSAFKNRGNASKPEAAEQWIQNNPAPVSRWLEQTEECVAAEGTPDVLPDSATYSSRVDTVDVQVPVQ